MSFLTRTNALDMHVMTRLDIRAKQISDGVKADSKRDGENYKDIDGPSMQELANMFANHEDTAVITEWLKQQDTAFRDYVPRMVFEILKDNTYE
tara:strand:+ start:1305 stop:1586 length:282 start_codon:yes stop_codon:yes gene_type:complete